MDGLFDDDNNKFIYFLSPYSILRHSFQEIFPVVVRNVRHKTYSIISLVPTEQHDGIYV